MAIVTRIQPQTAARINPGNPYARGLQFAWSAATPRLDLVSGAVGTPDGAGTSLLKISPLGIGRTGGGYTSANIAFANGAWRNSMLGEMTFLAIVSPSSVSGSDRTILANTLGNVSPGSPFDFGVLNGQIRLARSGTNFRAWASGATVLSLNTPAVIAVTHGADMSVAAKFYANGVFDTVSAVNEYGGGGSGPGVANSTPIRVFNRDSVDDSFPGDIYLILAWNRILSAAEIADISKSPWQVFQAPQRPTLAAAGGTTNTPVNPAVGALALTGYAPTLAQSANQSLTPNAGTLAITGYAPSIAQPQAVAPGVGSLALTGFAPTIAQSSTTGINPGAGSLALSGYSPTVAQSANVAINPATGTIAFAGYAPTISQPQAVTAGAGTLAITGYAPTVTQAITTNVAPGAGSLAFTGYAPSITQSANQQIAPQAGSVTFTGFAPSVAQSANQAILPAVGSLAITGYAPSISQAQASPNLLPATGALTITGYAPSVTQDAPVTKVGGDDVPERIEIWEARQPAGKRDAALDAVVTAAFAKATGKTPPAPVKAAVQAVAKSAPVIDDEDEEETLLLLM